MSYFSSRGRKVRMFEATRSSPALVLSFRWASPTLETMTGAEKKCASSMLSTKSAMRSSSMRLTWPLMATTVRPASSRSLRVLSRRDRLMSGKTCSVHPFVAVSSIIVLGSMSGLPQMTKLRM